MSRADWRQRRTSWTMRFLHVATLIFLLVAGLGPILWMLKSSITPTQTRSGRRWPCGPTAFDLSQLDAPGREPTSIAICSTRSSSRSGRGRSRSSSRPPAGFALSGPAAAGSRLSPGWIATLFVPPIVLLVPLYLTIVDVPSSICRMIDSYWAIWLPAGASAINVILMKRFFDNLPREIFEAARVDGAGPFRLFWSIVAADVTADPRRRLRLRGDRHLEGLPVAAARDRNPDPSRCRCACRPSSRRRTSACSSPR
jgi:multiple sugar transport system permease protein